MRRKLKMTARNAGIEHEVAVQVSAAGSPRILSRLTEVGRCRSLAITGICLALSAGAPPVIRTQAMPAFMGVVPRSNDAVTVAEGSGEPRCIGSCAPRTHEILDPDRPHDSFAAGLVREAGGNGVGVPVRGRGRRPNWGRDRGWQFRGLRWVRVGKRVRRAGAISRTVHPACPGLPALPSDFQPQPLLESASPRRIL